MGRAWSDQSSSFSTMPAWALACVVLAGLVLAAPAAANMQLGPPVTPVVFDGDLRDFPTAPDWKPGDPIKMIPKRSYPRPGLTIPPEPTHADPLLELQDLHTPAELAFSPPILSLLKARIPSKLRRQEVNRTIGRMP